MYSYLVVGIYCYCTVVITEKISFHFIKNPCILNIKESCLALRFSIIHCPGKWTRGPDVLSRQLVASSLSNLRSIPSKQDVFRCDAIHSISQIAAVCAVNELTSITLDNIRNAAHLDSQYQDLLQIIRSGFPSKRNLTEPAHLREFWEVRDRLFEMDSIALMDKRHRYEILSKSERLLARTRHKVG